MGWERTGGEYQESVRVKLAYGAACLCCRHFRGKGTCAAFPIGIPFAILDGRHDHRTEHYQGDRGLLWESGLHAVEVNDGRDTRQGHAKGQAPEGEQDTQGQDA